ncbi:hypothetical protein BABINDRAFT_166674 [Babjeviella inositovora NRRL Y-12698]|uniref:ASTRA-associated protein 1 n=1 Tax=Babjeviella inositovora NRRL Y-12698 TaxID=984486 RepID=A0A1E3QRK0_9ASCO|nr:uncharacterized protein BABINDRAFT_166674 [Babjeviella inositovora NRRL Y-12698]ODQ80336.1 hypothetical protein BABINDRAFT_166674 [Babjeviella inositovora NRRL Y-12698]
MPRKLRCLCTRATQPMEVSFEKLATLRGHNSDITTSLYFHVPNPNGRLTPTLVTGDSTGWLVWWDLAIRRPIGVWRAHDKTIITIKQLGVGLSELGEVAISGDSYGILVTHGKDGEVRLWSLLTKAAGMNEQPSYDFVKLSKTFPPEPDSPAIKDSALSVASRPYYISIPVNTLNFCNVDVAGGLLVTPSTVDSDKFDVYRLPSELNRFNRLVRLADPFQLLQANPKSFNVSIPSNSERGNFGSLMRIIVNESLLFVGFESGHVMGIHIPVLSGNQSANETEMHVVHLSDYHVPNPVISMRCENGNLISGSAGRTIEVVEVAKMTVSPNEAFRFKTSKRGANDLSLRDDGLLAVTGWDGCTRLYRRSGMDAKALEAGCFSKRNPLVTATHHTQNSDNKPAPQNVKARTVALTATRSRKSDVVPVRRRFRAEKTPEYMCIGYEDGTVEVYYPKG